MRLLFAAIGVAGVVASEVQQDLPSSALGRGVRGTYVEGESDTAVNRNDLKEDESFWNRLLQETEMSVVPTRPPTPQPTPATTPPPTPSPVIPTVPPPTPSPSVIDIILPVAKEGGAEFDDPDSYQSQALAWLEGNANVGSYTDEQIIQRYALASIYYSTFAVSTPATDAFLGAGVTPAGWTNTAGWVTDDEECTWFGLTCDDSGSVVSISLGNNFLTGTFACEVTLMNTTLTTLDIFRNPVYNTGDEDHDFLTMLPELQFLMLQQTNFRYPGLPPQLGSLNKLIEMDVSNTLYGGGPLRGEIFANMPNLRYLDISKNDYSSQIPLEIGNLPRLERFYAVDSGVTGDLSFLEPMPVIREMWIDLNPNLGGQIPDFIGIKSTLGSLGLSSSGFSGPLPASMGQLTAMKSLWLYNNGFTGEIPPEFGDMFALELLQIQMNDIGGSMPQEVCDRRPPGGALASLVADCVSEVTCAETCCTACF